MLTYNSPWDKTRQTLYSILIQKFTDFEIVIADDGSQDNNFSKIEEYFATNNFTNYTLVANKTNQGIVKNFNSGLVLCKGKYIKPISPGDFLYDENTLAAVYDEIKDGDAAVYFGRAAFYSNTNGELKLYPEKCNPRDLAPYIKKDYKAIRRNYLVNRDYILGASTFYKRDIFEKYFCDIKNIIKYAEDCTLIYMVANDEKFEYLPYDVIWYEYSSGISTSGDSKWAQRLYEDNKQTFAMLYNKRLIPYWIYEISYGESRYKRLLIKILHNPRTIIMRLFHLKSLNEWKYVNNERSTDSLRTIINS
jgi:glycosyltransferase involved in cell wall biosynthesis